MFLELVLSWKSALEIDGRMPASLNDSMRRSWSIDRSIVEIVVIALLSQLVLLSSVLLYLVITV